MHWEEETHQFPAIFLYSLAPCAFSATQADLPEDRVTVLSEIFTDITGELDPTAQSRLGAAAGTSFFEVLAQYLET